ncbi:MAG: hypothetical protein ACO1RX_16055 [Candidatus Sericytochromatia bacterium]
MRKAPSHFGLLLENERIILIEAEHGLVVQEPTLARRQGRHWQFGQAALAGEGPPLHLFSDLAFPQQAFFQWFLERVYPLRRMRLHLITSGFTQALAQGLWQRFFEQLGLSETVPVVSPLTCLAISLREGLLVWLDQGLGQLAVCRQGQLREHTAAGYGQYLARALRHYALERYQLCIDPSTASASWPRLGQAGQQLTLQGRGLQSQRSEQQLLTSEELASLYLLAFEPLRQELHYYQRLYPELPCHLLGPQATLAQGLPGELSGQNTLDTLLLQGIQHYLRRESR